MSETAALTQLKALLEPVDFELSADPTIYIYPDDFTPTLPTVSTPFVTIGIHESSDRRRLKGSYRTIEAAYTIYIRIYIQKGEIVPSTLNFATFENNAKGVANKLDVMLLSNPTLNNTILKMGNENGELSLWSYSYMPFNAAIYSGVEYLFNVVQEIN